MRDDALVRAGNNGDDEERAGARYLSQYHGGTRLAEVAVVAALAAGGHERRCPVGFVVVVTKPQRPLAIVIQRHLTQLSRRRER